MPYIKQENRPDMDLIVDLMHELDVAVNGDLNYILFAYCKRHIIPGYKALKNFCGELRQCATEIERKILAPYEDQKIKENGDVMIYCKEKEEEKGAIIQKALNGKRISYQSV